MSIIQATQLIFDAAATTATKRYLAFGERYMLTGAKVTSNGTVAAHAANFATITIYGSNGSTTAFQWSTEDGKEGALTDKTPASLKDGASGLTVYDAGTAIAISVTKDGGGSAPQLDCVLTLQLEQARKF